MKLTLLEVIVIFCILCGIGIFGSAVYHKLDVTTTQVNKTVAKFAEGDVVVVSLSGQKGIVVNDRDGDGYKVRMYRNGEYVEKGFKEYELLSEREFAAKKSTQAYEEKAEAALVGVSKN